MAGVTNTKSYKLNVEEGRSLVVVKYNIIGWDNQDAWMPTLEGFLLSLHSGHT